MTQQKPGQELPVMQAGFINLKARKMGVTLFLEPVEIGDKNGRDFNARNVRQHQTRVFVVVIGHTHASFLSLFKDGNRKRLWIFKKCVKGVNPCWA